VPDVVPDSDPLLRQSVPTTETFGPFPTVYYCEEELIRQMNRIERLPGARAAAAHCEIEM
jgi:hypothetical protein